MREIFDESCRCGYSLRGNSSGVCPECGMCIDQLPSEAQRRKEECLYRIVAMMVASAVGLGAMEAVHVTFYEVGSSAARVCKNGATIRSQVELFQVDCRPVQSTDTLTEVIWTRPVDVAADAWRGPYLSDVGELLDPWGNLFVLEVPGSLNQAGFDVVSYGADGVPGGVGENADVRR